MSNQRLKHRKKLKLWFIIFLKIFYNKNKNEISKSTNKAENYEILNYKLSTVLIVAKKYVEQKVMFELGCSIYSLKWNEI